MTTPQSHSPEQQKLTSRDTMAADSKVNKYQAWNTETWLEFDGGSPLVPAIIHTKDKPMNSQYDLWSVSTWDEGSFSSSDISFEGGNEHYSGTCEDSVPLLYEEDSIGEKEVCCSTPNKQVNNVLSPLRLSFAKDWSFKSIKVDKSMQPSLRSSLLNRKKSWKDLFESVSSLIWKEEENAVLMSDNPNGASFNTDNSQLDDSFCQKHVVVARRPSKGNSHDVPRRPATQATSPTSSRRKSKGNSSEQPPLPPELHGTCKTSDDRFRTNEVPTKNATPPLRRSYRHRFVVSKIIHIGLGKKKSDNAKDDWIVRPSTHWKKTLAPYGTDNPEMDIDVSSKSQSRRGSTRGSNGHRQINQKPKEDTKQPSLPVTGTNTKDKSPAAIPTNKKTPSRSASYIMAPRRSSSSHHHQQRLGSERTVLGSRRRCRRSLSQSVHGLGTKGKHDLSDSIRDMPESFRW